MMLRLSFDASRCDGYGMCCVIFPERITLDPWGYAHVDPAPIAGRAAQKGAQRAARCCPKQALSLHEAERNAG